MLTRTCLLSGLSLAFGSSAFGQITPITPFTGDVSEGMESVFPRQSIQNQYTVFGDAAIVRRVGGGDQDGLHVAAFWLFVNFMLPRSGSYFMGGVACNAEYEFTAPMSRFGGYFGTVSDIAGATATFYDADGNQIGQPQAIQAPVSSWAWDGWESTTPVKRIRIVASNSHNGFIMMDDLEITAGAQGCDADFNGDNQVDFFDYLDFAAAFDAEDPAADFNGDDQIDFFDYLDFVQAFDEGCD